MDKLRRAIFFDRDGVINEVVDRGENFLVRGKKVRYTAPFFSHEFKFRSGAREALKYAGDLGFFRVLVTNQPDVTYGLISSAEYDKIMTNVTALPFEDIFVCPHGREDGCACKKPKPGMLIDAAAKHKIDLASSFIIGDTENDMRAGKAAGCATVLIDYAHNQDLVSDFRVADLMEAIQTIKQIII